jgi:hypothetical protein
LYALIAWPLIIDSGNIVNCCRPVIGAVEQPANKKPPQQQEVRDKKSLLLIFINFKYFTCEFGQQNVNCN